jgi:FkbM family methyltransferase
MRLGYEMLVDMRSGTERSSYYTGDFDTDQIQSIQRLAVPAWVALDVGANIGFWTVPLAQTAKRCGGVVYAFEPVPSNYSRLELNLSQNQVRGHVHLYRIGLSDSRRLVEISLREDFAACAETGNAAIVIDAEDQKFKRIAIEVDTLDQVVADGALSRVDFIKVDIEGHEDRFLEGARHTIARFQPVLHMEINEPYYQRRGADALGMLEAWMGRASYCSALADNGRWRLASIRERRRELDNVLLLPSRTARSHLANLNA